MISKRIISVHLLIFSVGSCFISMKGLEIYLILTYINKGSHIKEVI